MSETQSTNNTDDEQDGNQSLGFRDIASALRSRWQLLAAVPLAAGALAIGITYLLAPTFTAVTTFLPPQQAQAGAASALASLGTLGGLAAGAAGLKTPGEQYVALMQSVTISDRLVEQFKLMDVYDKKFRIDARQTLAKNARISAGKKDGLITVEIDDESPQRAAEIANRYVEELRRLTGTLAVTEAQQRRVFFDEQLKQSRERLRAAQQALEATGFNPGALKAEPRAEIEAYARLKAEVTAADVRLQTLRGSLTDSAPEVRRQQTALVALRQQLARATQATASPVETDYIGSYRDFKYEETLFELYARQLEAARVDESREGALIQVVDRALVPEKKSKPKRLMVGLVTTMVAFFLLAGGLIARHSMHPAKRHA